jgi:isopentenyldiphosphate isomerase
VFAGEPAPDPAEVEDWKWAGMRELRESLRAEPARYSYWLKVAVESGGWQRLNALVGVE